MIQAPGKKMRQFPPYIPALVILSLAFAWFQSKPLWEGKYLLDLGGEANLTNKILAASSIDFTKGQFPLWNPLFGPGGSHTTILGFVPWDFRYLLDRFVHSRIFIFSFDLFLCCLTFCVTCAALSKKNIINLGLAFLAFLFYLNIEFIKFFFGYFYQNSIYIITPLLFLIIYLFENKKIGLPLMATSLTALLWFGAEGSKVELWLFQLPVVGLFWILALQWALKKKISFKNFLIYLVPFFVFLLTVSWKIYLLLPQIIESTRIHKNEIKKYDLLKTFLNSFPESSAFLYGSLFLFSALLIIHKKIKTCIALVILGTFWLVIFSTPFREDFSKLKIWIWIVVIILPWMLLFYDTPNIREKVKRAISISLLLWATFSLLLQDTHIYNWGNPCFAQLPIVVSVFFLSALFLSSVSKDKFGEALTLFLGLFILFRDHVSILLLQKFVLVWHIQRDSSFFLFPMCYLFFIGLKILFDAWANDEKIKSRLLKIVALAWIMFSSLPFREGFYRSYLTVPRSEFRSADEIPFRARVFRIPYCEPSNSWAPLEGFERDIHEVSIYGSTISKYARQMFEKKEIIRDSNLNFLWFPNNIQRSFNILFDVRLQKYLETITPGIDLNNNSQIDKISPEYIIANSIPNNPQLKRIKQIAETGKTKVFLFKNKNFQTPQFICDNTSNKQIKNLGIETDYFDEPKLKSRFTASFFLGQESEVTVLQTFSGLWNYKVNGKSVQAKSSTNGFTILPAYKGENLIEAEYARHIKKILWLGFFIFFINCFLLINLLIWKDRRQMGSAY